MLTLTPQEMRDVDALASQRVGDVTLMRTAGERIAETVKRYAQGTRVVAFAGPGNNGGDAFAALALLDGFERRIYSQNADHPSEARRDAQERARERGVQFLDFPGSRVQCREALHDADVIVVGLIGTGARLPLPPIYVDLVTAINESGAPCLAIDIPPGIDADSGNVPGAALRATATVTLGALKPGLLLPPGRTFAGDLWFAEIGIPDDVIAGAPHHFDVLSELEFEQMLPVRPHESDKRTSGAPLIIAGSQQFPGAAVLAAMGAARAGAGYVTVAAPRGATGTLRAHLVEQVVVEIDPDCPSDEVVRTLLDVSRHSSSVGIGPGLPLDDRTGEWVRAFVSATDLPIVVDASGLFHFAKNLELLRGKSVVLTPHEGEFARLSAKGTIAPGTHMERLREFVDRTGIATLLKGESTLVYDGTTMHINPTGTSALATAGTGDVLTGMIATLMSQGLRPVDAARAAAYWHGLAGKHASSLRRRGVIARDVYESLAAVVPAGNETARPLMRIL